MLSYRSASFTFDNGKMFGFIKKQAQSSSMFGGKTSQLRFLIIDFKAGVMVLKHSKETTDAKKVKMIQFSDIQGVQHRDGEDEIEAYSFKFCLKTKERMYIMKSRNLYERSIWLAAFKFVIEMAPVMQAAFSG